ncbi:hypothetical protein K435DRAFT_77831 [Dendrothele bispora CBS 962.96]|uniref:Uncharacterized protein n=1 Tax=Dendrothele bispora (strain CBS 962.96) TaxID=1314807 RepID=A0A4S8M487_DENBC|nr:hypothetical protein K435DRAFT_77831 [Dendrothele bispora CBS 962.96]
MVYQPMYTSLMTVFESMALHKLKPQAHSKLTLTSTPVIASSVGRLNARLPPIAAVYFCYLTHMTAVSSLVGCRCSFLELFHNVRSPSLHVDF